MALVEYVVRDQVAHLELNRPGVANALDLETARELQEVVTRARRDSEVRAVLVSGAGKRFCAGGDVESFATAADPPGYLLELATEADAACRSLAELEKPVAVAVHGAVAGAGLGLMLSADLVVAAPGTKFAFAYPAIGCTPDCGVSYLLPRAIGQQRALAFALSGRAASAEEALEWGLVSQLEEEPLARAWEIARNWAAGPAEALGQVRRLLRAGWQLGREEMGQEEARSISRAVQGDEAQRLITQFLGSGT